MPLRDHLQMKEDLFSPKSENSNVAASGPTVWTIAYALESTHCNRLLIEPSYWAQTVHMFTPRLYVSRDLTVTSCAGCVFLLAFLRVYLRPRGVLHGPSFRVVSRASCCRTDRSTVFCVLCLFMVVTTSRRLR